MSETTGFDLALIERVPSLPGAVLELIRSFDAADISAVDIAHKISHDPGLCLRVLRVVNSPFYGLRRQIASLSEAVMVLGFATVRSLALGAALMSRLPSKRQGEFDPAVVWEHSLYCALCARRLAKRAGSDPEWAFTAGLLHDVGKLAMYATEPTLFGRVASHHGERCGTFFAQAEREVLGIDHCMVGAELLTRWQLPASIADAARAHHDPDAHASTPLNDLIYLADLLAHATAANTLADDMARIEPTPAFSRLGLCSGQCDADLKPLPAEFAAMRDLLST